MEDLIVLYIQIPLVFILQILLVFFLHGTSLIAIIGYILHLKWISHFFLKWKSKEIT